MSSYADILVDNKQIFTYRNEVSPEALSLFRPEELKRIPSTASDAPPWSRYVDDEAIELCFYQVEAAVLREWLDVLGYSMVVLQGEFDRELAQTIERTRDFLGRKSLGKIRSDLKAELKALESLTFQSWLANVAAYISAPQANLTNPTGRSDKNGPLGFLDYLDERLVMRAIAEAAQRAVFTLDVTDLAEGGWMDPNSSEEDELVQSWLRKESAPVIITEGRRDAQILQRSIGLLKPHLTDYIKFLDYDFRNEGSAASAVGTIKSFAAAGISNRVLVLQRDFLG
jgi:hypothetical protein